MAMVESPSRRHQRHRGFSRSPRRGRGGKAALRPEARALATEIGHVPTYGDSFAFTKPRLVQVTPAGRLRCWLDSVSTFNTGCKPCASARSTVPPDDTPTIRR